MNCEIISIGDELLIGQVVNTNASWMAEKLNEIGVDVKNINAVADDGNAINKALKQALKNYDVVLITGGLGPTKDDITKKILCKFFKSRLVFDKKVFKQVENIFKKRGLQVTEVNRQQAEVPHNCKVFYNNVGTAPGMCFEQNGKMIVSMPGVPYEMQYVMQEHVLPMLQKRNHTSHIVHKTIMTIGMGESFLADRIAHWEDALPSYIKLAYLPQPGMLRLRLSARGKDKKQLQKEVDNHVKTLNKIIPELIFGYDEERLEQVIGKLLLKNKQTLATAESCTGGNIARMITEIPGASAYFKGSVVAYDNEVKKNLLNVDVKTLKNHGAVSEETVTQMAFGVQKLLKTDYAIATSGIAGPDGGTPEKPVGTVWVAVATPQKVIAQRFIFTDNRIRTILRASLSALNMLRMAMPGDRKIVRL